MICSTTERGTAVGKIGRVSRILHFMHFSERGGTDLRHSSFSWDIWSENDSLMISKAINNGQGQQLIRLIQVVMMTDSCPQRA